MSSSRTLRHNLCLSRTLLSLSWAAVGFLAGDSAATAAEPEAPVRPVISPSVQTTKVTEPVDAEGYVDFIAALNAQLGAGIAADENAAIPLLQAMGPSAENSVIPNLILKELGQREWQSGDIDFQSQGEFFRVKAGADPELGSQVLAQYDQAMNRPWKAEELPQIAALLGQNGPALDAISVAVRRPKYFRPLVRQAPTDDMISILLPDIQESRDVARQLQTRAMLHLGSGNLEAARHDLLTMHHLARHIANGATLIEGLVGVAIESMAIAKDNLWALHPDQTVESLAAYRQELRTVPWTGEFARSLDLAERYMAMDVIQNLARGRGTSAWSNIGFGQPTDDGTVAAMGISTAQLTQLLTSLTLDWNVALETMHPIYDDLVAMARISTRTDRMAAITKFNTRLDGYRQETASFTGIVSNVLGGNKARGRNFARTLASLLVPAVAQAREAEDRLHTRQQVRNLFLAAVEYRLAHGTYPESLDQLAPAFSDESTVDIYCDRPLRYVTDGASLQIYSLGPNGIDNRGQTFGSGDGHDDLVCSDPPPT